MLTHQAQNKMCMHVIITALPLNGEQREFYPGFPGIEQLRVMYGK